MIRLLSLCNLFVSEGSKILHEVDYNFQYIKDFASGKQGYFQNRPFNNNY